MAETLEGLALQGDPGTLETEEQASRIELLNPQQLYQLWERQHWVSHEIDFSTDQEQWADLTEEERDYYVWGMAAFFIGEERVTTQFSGLVMAYEDESEEAFLTTQQVDEARHSQFFDRYYREVIGIDDPSWEKRLGRVREELNDAFVELFDRALVDANKRLIASPMPRPPDLVVTKLSNICSRSTFAPTPVSATATSTWPRTGWLEVTVIRRSIWPPRTMASLAFMTRFKKTCWSWMGSPDTGGRPGADTRRIVMCFRARSGCNRLVTSSIRVSRFSPAFGECSRRESARSRAMTEPARMAPAWMSAKASAAAASAGLPSSIGAIARALSAMAVRG